MALENRNITSANATITMVVEDLYPQGVRLEQFSTDTAVSQNDSALAETRMGIDGQMVSGYVDEVKEVTITLEPSSPSVPYLETVAQAMRTNRTIYQITLLVNLPALGKTITYSNGVMKTAQLLPGVKRVLDPVSYTFDFESMSIQ